MGYPDVGFVRLSNVAPLSPCADWVWMGTQRDAPPTLLTAVDLAGARYPAFAVHRALMVRAPLTANQTKDFRLEPRTPADRAIVYDVAPEIAADPSRSVPKLFVELTDGSVHESLGLGVETRTDWHPVMLRSCVTARWTQVPGLVVRGELDVFTGQRVIEWTFEASYGCTTPGLPFRAGVKRIWAEFGHFAVVDDWESKGLRPVAQFGDRWRVELVGPSADWSHGRAVRVRGALLCVDGSAEQVAEVQYRREARPWGLCGGWDGFLGPFGVVPVVGSALTASFRETVWRRLHRAGTDDDPREFVHHPYAGQTGLGPDFGAVWGYGAHILGTGDPSLIHFVQRDIDAEFRRPVHRFESASSRPIRAADHPQCRTFSGVPHDGWGTDLLGMPNPVPGWSGYTEPDDQHRTGLAARMLYALTRCPALGRHINDCLEQDLMAWWRGRIPKLGEGGTDDMAVVPRQWGRPLMIWCWDHTLGLPQAERLIREAVDWMHRASAWQLRDETVDVQVFGERLYKYGWVESDGSTPIWSWWPWMEATTILALRAADLLFDLPKAREMVLRASRTIVRHGFYQHGGRWHCAYSVRTRADGSALPASSYWPGDNTNPDVYTIPDWSVWEQCVPVAKILQAMEPDGPDVQRCRDILSAYALPGTEFGAAHFAVR